MSTGGIIGTVAGGAIGFALGGPLGAGVGAGLGLGAGMLIDPVKPNIAKQEPTQLSIPTSEEGSPIAEVLGLSQLSGNFIWYCCPRSKEIKKKQGGKGGGGAVVTGYRYYLTFAIGICEGTVDRLYCIYENGLLLWQGPLILSSATNGKVTISVENRGEIDFYFGTDDQTANSCMSEETMYSVPYRGLCYAVFKDFMIGQYNRVGALQFVIEKRPEYSFSTLKDVIHNYNPAHALYHLLVTKAGLSSDQINEQSFIDAADTLHTEQLGISILMKEEEPLIRYIESICQHIRACLYVNAAGEIAIRLYRKDILEEDMITITENDILEEIDFERQSMIDAKNEVQIQTNTITEE